MHVLFALGQAKTWYCLAFRALARQAPLRGSLPGAEVQLPYRSRKYLFVFIDGMSRLVTHAEFYLSEGRVGGLGGLPVGNSVGSALVM